MTHDPIDLLREFAADVASTDPEKLRDEWPDLYGTYRKVQTFLLETDGWQVSEFEVLEHFLPALINDDRTGLTDDEEHALDMFLEKQLSGPGHWDYEHSSGAFGTCEITGYKATLATVRWMFKHG